MANFDLSHLGIFLKDVWRNPSPAQLYEEAILRDGGVIVDSGALLTRSGSKTGRSPKDKRIVEDPETADDVWWGAVNITLSEQAFVTNRQRARDFLNFRQRLYVIDGYAGWDPRYQLKVRVICARPYHALFMHNMLVRLSPAELKAPFEPDYVIYNAGEFPANIYTQQMTSKTTIELSFKDREFIILGTEYAGEMKKGVFTLMNYLMPKRGVLSMHCSANEGADGDVSLFFGLSGTGKTTLSADARRNLIGDDEHCWTDDGVFNIEGGCYAKCIGLSKEKEPEIFSAVRFGALLENTTCDVESRRVNFEDDSITENTRASYPIEFIPNAKIPCVGTHPRNIILLTCDAFGVLPPVSKLTPAQAMYHFISGYSAKVAGTEVGVREPQATFSACFGAAFLVWHPTKYARLLADKMSHYAADAWLVNTGWSGGGYGEGTRIKLADTRAIIDAIHSGELAKQDTVVDPVFGLHIPTSCPGVSSAILQPREVWRDKQAYDRAARRLARLFSDNFAQFADVSDAETRAAGPNLAAVTA